MNTRFCLRPYDKVVSEKLEHAGILRPIARALSARGVKSSDDLLEDWTALLPPATLQGTQQAALTHEQTQKYLDGKAVKKVIVVPGKIVNIVL